MTALRSAGPSNGPSTGLRSEAQLICRALALEAAGPHSKPVSRSGLEELLARDLDWDWILAFTAQNGVSSLLWRSLQAHVAIPERVRLELQQRMRTNRAEVLLIRAELDRILRILHDDGITVLPYKGPALAEELYPSVTLREAGDIDLLVLAPDVVATIYRIASLGYEPLLPIDPASLRELQRTGYELGLTGHSGRITVEVHWDLMPRSLGSPLDMQYLTERLTRKTRNEIEVYALPPETLALVLCQHAGAKHGWTHLRMLLDIAYLLRQYPALDVAALLSESRRLRIFVATASGLLAAHQLVGASVPPEVIAGLRADPVVTAEAAVIHARVFRADRGLPGFREWQAYARCLGCSAQGRWRYLQTILSPRWQDHLTGTERMRSRLGARFMRPWRLVFQHGLRIFQRL